MNITEEKKRAVKNAYALLSENKKKRRETYEYFIKLLKEKFDEEVTREELPILFNINYMASRIDPMYIYVHKRKSTQRRADKDHVRVNCLIDRMAWCKHRSKMRDNNVRAGEYLSVILSDSRTLDLFEHHKKSEVK